MEEMRRIAFSAVWQACGVASLVIFCIMIGLSFSPRWAFQAGGMLTMIMAVALTLKSRQALTQDYRQTRIWLYLPRDSRPPEAEAQCTISTVMRETYLTFAMRAAGIAIVQWALALIVSLTGS